MHPNRRLSQLQQNTAECSPLIFTSGRPRVGLQVSLPVNPRQAPCLLPATSPASAPRPWPPVQVSSQFFFGDFDPSSIPTGFLSLNLRGRARIWRFCPQEAPQLSGKLMPFLSGNHICSSRGIKGGAASINPSQKLCATFHSGQLVPTCPALLKRKELKHGSD